MVATDVVRAIRDAVTDLVHEHAWVLDRGDPRQLPQLYTEDGELLGLGEPLRGRAALQRWADARATIDRVSRHVHSNLRVWTDADGGLRGSVITTLYRHDGPGGGEPHPVMVLDYDDRYAVDDDGTCRFRSRQITRVYVDHERVPA
jgi:hypothetical protein